MNPLLVMSLTFPGEFINLSYSVPTVTYRHQVYDRPGGVLLSDTPVVVPGRRSWVIFRLAAGPYATSPNYFRVTRFCGGELSAFDIPKNEGEVKRVLEEQAKCQ